MQIGHQLCYLAMRMDQVIAHIARMARRVTQPCNAVDLCKCVKEPGQAPEFAIGSRASIRIDVLTEQRDLARTVVGKPPRFLDNLNDGARIFAAPRVGHHAKRTELVATLLYREKCGRARRRT